MKAFLAALVFSQVLFFGVFAQTPDDLNEGTTLEYDSVNSIWRFKWWGRSGNTYFIQHSDDLQTWSWIPIVEPGDDSVKEWGLTTTSDRFFMRLRHTDTPTTDPENDDFDGDGVPNIFEIMNGFNPFGITDANNNGMPDEWELFNTGKFAIWPPSLSASIPRNQTANGTIYLRNDTGSPVTYSVALADNFWPSYSYDDSVSGNVLYDWEEISVTGTRLDGVSNEHSGTEAADIIGFAFPFYGNNYARVFVSNNGLLAFGQSVATGGNIALPSSTGPKNLIAPFWDNLDTRTIGDIYYKEESDRLIIQYENVGRFGGGTGRANYFL